jgi:hypothetical protein
MSTKQSPKRLSFVVSTEGGRKIWHQIPLGPNQSILYERGNWLYRAVNNPAHSEEALMKTAWDSEQKFHDDTDAMFQQGRVAPMQMNRTRRQAYESIARSTCHQLHELHRPEFTLLQGDTPPISMTPPFAIGINNAGNAMSQRAKSTKTKEQPITNHSSVAPTWGNDEEDEETERAESAKTGTEATATTLS